MLDFKKVRALRREQDLTQEYIAALMEISPPPMRVSSGEKSSLKLKSCNGLPKS